MGAIIELIIKIFSALFEEDRKRRIDRQSQQHGGHHVGGAQGQAGPGAKPVDSGDKQRRSTGHRTIDEFLAEAFGLELEPPLPPKKKMVKPPPLPRSQRRSLQRDETFEEHIKRTSKSMDNIEAENRRLADETDRQLRFGGNSAKPPKVKPPKVKPKTVSRLPRGISARDLIYAHVILGPCKARKRMFPRPKLGNDELI